MAKKNEFAGMWMNYYDCMRCGNSFMYPSSGALFCYKCGNENRVFMTLTKHEPGSFFQNDLWERDLNLSMLDLARRVYLIIEKNASPDELNEKIDEMCARKKIEHFWHENPHPTEKAYDAFFYQKGIARYCICPTETDERYIASMKEWRKKEMKK